MIIIYHTYIDVCEHLNQLISSSTGRPVWHLCTLSSAFYHNHLRTHKMKTNLKRLYETKITGLCVCPENLIEIYNFHTKEVKLYRLCVRRAMRTFVVFQILLLDYAHIRETFVACRSVSRVLYLWLKGCRTETRIGRSMCEYVNIFFSVCHSNFFFWKRLKTKA